MADDTLRDQIEGAMSESRPHCFGACNAEDEPVEAMLGPVLAVVEAHVRQRQAEALRGAARALTTESSVCGAYEPPGSPDRAEYERLSKIGGPHYPDTGWAYCDGCSAAASADTDRASIICQLEARADELDPRPEEDR